MISPDNSFLQILLALAFVIASGYAFGRIHQWYKHGLERDHAYREGYDHASRSMFTMALQVRSPAPQPAAVHAASPAIEATPAVARRPQAAIGMARRRMQTRPAIQTPQRDAA
ncbi:hypothetical protein [Mangrovihabitans endophyticus]|uniref:Uncharacterized protein n=1 Tax=Mangrovihabitans endophyticus TaxID=1751298 RepID=A0A8J3C3Q0_9ACTN|nr:hypothetical protein [Mangrovihabitans endophyticus]GGL04743.1 hypothetical protein GCM10012284_44140 [Mangrovihabitans endophyticus]